MGTQYNDIFEKLLTEYNLPKDLSFQIELPTEVQNIVNDEILILDEGITLKSFNKLYKASENWENQSIIEDNENHFHVDWFINPQDEKHVFKLGVQTLKVLSERFKNEGLTGIRFSYSFQNQALSEKQSRFLKLDEEGDDHFISDRISFHNRREGEEIIEIDNNKKLFEAVLIIDI